MAQATRVRTLLMTAIIAALAACGGGGGGGGGGDLPDIDQDFTPATLTCGAGISTDPPEQAMTFTAGRSGTLTHVELMLQRGPSSGVSDVILEVRPTVGDVPDPDDGNVIVAWSRSSIDWPTSPGLFTFDLSTFGATVTAGEVYAIVLRGVASGDLGGWSGSMITSDYPDGDGYVRTTSSADFILGSCDFAFRTRVE